jgi:hypothetical protein
MDKLASPGDQANFLVDHSGDVNEGTASLGLFCEMRARTRLIFSIFLLYEGCFQEVQYARVEAPLAAIL